MMEDRPKEDPEAAQPPVESNTGAQPEKKKESTSQLLRALFAEFLAMTMFVFIGCGAALSTAQATFDPTERTQGFHVSRLIAVAFAFGYGIVVLAFCIGPYSGGHIK